MRDFLKGLELSQETIDSIMAEVGKRHEKLEGQIESLKQENDGYKTTISELNTTINELNGKLDESAKSLESFETMANENKQLKAEMSMKDSKVKSEFMKFVGSEIMSQVSDDKDFASVLEDYKKENPQYFADTVVKKVQSSPALTGGNPEPQSTNSIMNDILRGNK